MAKSRLFVKLAQAVWLSTMVSLRCKFILTKTLYFRHGSLNLA